MAAKKTKIVIIEDDYRQFQIIRDLLIHDYEIFPSITTEEQFKVIIAKMIRFLDEEDNEFPAEFNDYNDVAAFIVDYKLLEDSNKTGIHFCELTECIKNGLTPVLFLTICPDAEIENEIRNIENRIPNIDFDNLRKPELWDNKSKQVDDIVKDSKSLALKDSIKKKIEKLIQETTKKNQHIHTATE